VTTLSNDPSASVQQAKSRLETAVERLERAIEARAGRLSAPSDTNGELTAARTEIGRLKETNRTVTARLDAAIGKVKVLLDE
jgi:hypothetical protein